jgi:hypothetical protein
VGLLSRKRHKLVAHDLGGELVGWEFLQQRDRHP